MDESLNVFDEPLRSCNDETATGFFRDGCCNTSPQDVGSHTVCAQMSAEFLAFSKAAGNDLSTPRPEFDFPGLRPGDSWCLCAPRWMEAYRESAAPRVYLRRTHKGALEHAPLSLLREFALDLN